jgi:hypothetical protein
MHASWAALCTAARTTSGQLFAFFVCLYVFTCQGRTNSYDGQSMYFTAQAIADRGTLALAHPVFGVPGRGGLSYSFYGIGMSLVELPLYLVGKLVGLAAGSKSAQVAEAVTMLANPLLVALLVALAYAALRALDYPRATAVRATLVLGVATSLWPYSKTDLSEPLLALGVAVAVLGAVRLTQLWSQQSTPASVQPPRTAVLDRWSVALGCGLGVAMLAKYIALAFVPLFCLYLTLAMPRPLRLATWLRRQALVLAPALVAGLIVLLVNDLRFGSPLQTGYPPGGRLFSIPVTIGATGLLVSLTRGLLFYDPLVFVGLLALPLLLWRRPLEALLPLGLVVISLVLYGGFVDWGGGDSWGPRYLLPVMPTLLWSLTALGCFGSVGARERLLPSRIASRMPFWTAFLRDRTCADVERAARGGTETASARRLGGVGGKVGVALLLALGIVPQVLGVLVNFLLISVYRFDPASVTSPRDAVVTCPLVMAVWLLPLALRFAFTHTLPASGFAAQNFPFGPPYPLDPHLPATVGQYYAQTFWFTLLPHSPLAFGVGVVILGGGMALAGRVLWRQVRHVASEHSVPEPGHSTVGHLC